MCLDKKTNKYFVGGLNIITYGIFAYYFYQYAYANPDAGECWATASSATPLSVETAGYKNVTAQFHSWFYWGFIINIVSVVLGVFQILAGVMKSEGLAKLATMV